MNTPGLAPISNTPSLPTSTGKLAWRHPKRVALLALALLALTAVNDVRAAETTSTAKPGTALPPEARPVKVFTKRDETGTHFFVQNDEYCEITITFEPALVNMQCDQPLPYTATFPARQTSEALTLTPCDRDAKWEFSYTNYYKLGSNTAQHDDTCVYQLPYAVGGTFKVTQGYNGKFSHTGSNQYATDWQMPEGTPVYATRGGMVVKLKDDSDKGGGSMKYDKFNNFVLIRHDDGTLGHYCHLKKGGMVVKVGQIVKAGELIAHSGNTGFSSGPHLHFCVFKTVNGHERVSIPVQFRTAASQAVTLLSGHSYKAVAAQTTPSTPTAVSATTPPAEKNHT